MLISLQKLPIKANYGGLESYMLLNDIVLQYQYTRCLFTIAMKGVNRST